MAARPFSNQVGMVETESAASMDVLTRPEVSSVKSIWQISQDHLKEQSEKAAEEASELEILKTASTVPGAFKELDEDGDSKFARSIQRRINNIVKQEIDLIKFKDQVSQEKLAQDAYVEVVTKENFFFKIDEQKKERNL